MTFVHNAGAQRRMRGRRSALLLRGGLALLGLASAWMGAWAFFSPRSFYDDSPGAGRSWVSLLPPYNEHLTTDVGGFYLALALLFAWAAVSLSRQLVGAVLTAYLLASALHLGYHVTHLESFPTADKVGQTLGFVVLIRRGPRPARDLHAPGDPPPRLLSVLALPSEA